MPGTVLGTENTVIPTQIRSWSIQSGGSKQMINKYIYIISMDISAMKKINTAA